jgi:hypothetical protein
VLNYKYMSLHKVAQSAVNHTLSSEGHKFEFLILLSLRRHVKKKKKKIISI